MLLEITSSTVATNLLGDGNSINQVRAQPPESMAAYGKTVTVC